MSVITENTSGFEHLEEWQEVKKALWMLADTLEVDSDVLVAGVEEMIESTIDSEGEF